jgi:ATP-binding cassette subfamily B protein
MNARGRGFLAPEVIQTSAMDCGRRALKSLLEGFGIHASYGRLREACQTSVDGTSIDTLEALAACWAWRPSRSPCRWRAALPGGGRPAGAGGGDAASGLTHFLVVWRVPGPGCR